MPSRKVSPKEAKQLMDEGWTYVDVRSEPEFEQGHPAGAVNLPLMHAGPAGMAPNPAFLEIAAKAFAKDQKLVVGCMAGGRSAKAVAALEQAGFTQLADQRAGYGGSKTEAGWAAEKLPVQTGKPAGRTWTDLQKLQKKAGT